MARVLDPSYRRARCRRQAPSGSARARARVRALRRYQRKVTRIMSLFAPTFGASEKPPASSSSCRRAFEVSRIASAVAIPRVAYAAIDVADDTPESAGVRDTRDPI